MCDIWNLRLPAGSRDIRKHLAEIYDVDDSPDLSYGWPTGGGRMWHGGRNYEEATVWPRGINFRIEGVKLQPSRSQGSSNLVKEK